MNMFGKRHQCPYTKDVGALIYVKVGHLHANEIKASN
jgi:hypothetical protein